MRREIRFRLNGEAVSAQIAPHESLVEVLQDNFGLYGARESCGQGMCGCCTVLVNGRAVSGCLYLAALPKTPACKRSKAAPSSMPCSRRSSSRAPSSAASARPGFILMTRQLLDEHPDPDEDAIKHYLSGNLCRCGAYPEIIEAVKLAAKKRRKA